MIPFWNTEADRFRAAALAARRDGEVPAGILQDVEMIVDQVRAALRNCDELIASTPPGDHQLMLLVNAASEFEALLGSLYRSLERIEDQAGHALGGKPAVTIVRAPLTGGAPQR
jgi:hypothetical protein